MKQQADAPAEPHPDDPVNLIMIVTRCVEVHGREETGNDDVLCKVNLEALYLAHMRQRESFIRADILADGRIHFWLL